MKWYFGAMPLALFLLFFLLGNPAKAEALDQRFQRQWEEAIQLLQKSGLHYLGNDESGAEGRVAIEDLARAGRKIRVKILPELRKPEGATRYSAFYEPKTQTIYLDRSLQAAPRIRSLLLHEALGALGYGDRAYNLSLPLALYLRSLESDFPTKRPELVRAVLKEYLTSEVVAVALREKILFAQDTNAANGKLLLAAGERELGGGATVVGGAGDLTSLLIREAYSIRRMEQVLPMALGSSSVDTKWFVESIFLDVVMNTAAEPITGCDKGKKPYFAAFETGTGAFSLTAHFPAGMSPDEVVNEMLWFRDQRDTRPAHPQLDAAFAELRKPEERLARYRRFLREECGQ